MNSFSINSKILRLTFAFSLSVLVLSFIFMQFDFSTIDQLLSNISPWYLFPALLINIIAIWATSYKFNIFFNTVKSNPSLSMLFLYSVVSLHFFAINFFPFRLGEASFFLLLKKKYTAHVNFTNLFLSRIIDTIVIFGLLSFSSIKIFTYKEILFFFSNTKWSSLLYFIIVGLFILFSLYLLQWRWNLLSKSFTIVTKINIFSKIFATLVHAKNMLMHFWKEKKLQLFLISIFSLLQYLLFSLSMYFLYNFFSINLTYWQILWLGSVCTVIGFFPIHGILGLGSTQIIAIAILLLFGIPKEICAPLSIGIHLIFLINITILGLIGGIIYLAINYSNND